jgi:uncharacterized membrane protein YqjE
METQHSNTDDLLDQSRKLVQQYIADRVLLLKMETAEKSAKIIAMIALGMIAGGLLFFVLFFLSLMVGYFFAERLDNLFYGFAIVAGFYVLLLLVCIVVFKKWVAPKIIDKIIAVFFETKDT